MSADINLVYVTYDQVLRVLSCSLKLTALSRTTYSEHFELKAETRSSKHHKLSQELKNEMKMLVMTFHFVQ